MNNAVVHRTVAVSASILFLDLALWVAGQHLLLSPIALALAGLLPLLIGIIYLRYFNLDIPLNIAGIGSTLAIAYASLGTEANVFGIILLVIPACALWIASLRRTPIASASLLAASAMIFAAWSIQWRLADEYALGLGACFVASAALLARFYARQQHSYFAEATSICAILFVACGAFQFHLSAPAFFAVTISVALLFGLLASRASLVICVLLSIAAALVVYSRFESIVALTAVFAATLVLAHYTQFAVLAGLSRLALIAGANLLPWLHPSVIAGSTADPLITHLWCGSTLLLAGQAFVLAYRKELDHKLTLLAGVLLSLTALFSELSYFAGLGIVLTLAAALIGGLVTLKSKPIGLSILGLAALKLFAVDWQFLNGPPRVAIFMIAAVAMLLLAVRVKNTPDEQR